VQERKRKLTCLKHGCDGRLDAPIEKDAKTAERFIRCPKCGAKNGLMFSVDSPPGHYRLGRLFSD